MISRLLPALVVSFVLGCAPVAERPVPEAAGPRRGVARLGRPVMGTLLQVTVQAADRATARRLAERAFAVAAAWDAVLTTWRDDGELAQLNRRAGTGWQPVSEKLQNALAAMVSLSARTAGAFDPAVGSLVAELRDGETAVANGRSRVEISRAVALAPGRAKLDASVALDAGGIGKGIALDAVARDLSQHGATAVFLDFGGSSQLAFGFADEAPKMIIAGLRPGEVVGTITLGTIAPGTVPRTVPLGAVAPGTVALSTSRSPGSRAAGPIVDPRSWSPVVAARTVTVVGPSATLTEVWSTALVVLGRAGIPRAIADGVEVLFVDRDGVIASPNFPGELRACVSPGCVSH